MNTVMASYWIWDKQKQMEELTVLKFLYAVLALLTH